MLTSLVRKRSQGNNLDTVGNSVQPRLMTRFFNRLTRAVKPLIPALILDGVDFLTFGPLGIYFGMIVGCPVGYWMCSQYRLSFLKRIFGACLAGVYCSLPFTGFLPAAALVSFYARFWEHPE